MGKYIDLHMHSNKSTDSDYSLENILNNTKNLESIFMPFRNRYLNYIWKKIYPRIISNKARLLILAHLQCESHLPRILYKLRNS